MVNRYSRFLRKEVISNFQFYFIVLCYERTLNGKYLQAIRYGTFATILERNFKKFQSGANISITAITFQSIFRDGIL